MIPPPTRCYCGQPLAHLWGDYWGHIRAGKSARDAATAVGIGDKMYCCRGMLLGIMPSTNLEMPRQPPEGSTFRFRTGEMKPDDMPVRYFDCR